MQRISREETRDGRTPLAEQAPDVLIRAAVGTAWMTILVFGPIAILWGMTRLAQAIEEILFVRSALGIGP